MATRDPLVATTKDGPRHPALQTALDCLVFALLIVTSFAMCFVIAAGFVLLLFGVFGLVQESAIAIVVGLGTVLVTIYLLPVPWEHIRKRHLAMCYRHIWTPDTCELVIRISRRRSPRPN
ncbi:hypothetical protein HY634_00750 [Candidatus Uhrbacteria bacterium]|nr:hypothetical protein [Candidatus Uhrbacteria bacterium]